MTGSWQNKSVSPPRGVAVPMQQHPRYGATCRLLGLDLQVFALGAEAGPRSTAQVLVRRWPGLGRFALLSRGPVWAPATDDGQRHAALQDLLSDLKRHHMGVIATPDRLGQNDPLTRSGLMKLVTSGSLATLDLTPDRAARRRAQHGKWRNRLRRAEDARLPVTLTRLPPDPKHWLLLAEAAQAKARRYRRLPPVFSAAWASTGPDSTLLASVDGPSGPIAAMLFLLHHPGATYHIGWSNAEGRAQNAHTLLLWRASCWLADHGFAQLDLGTLDTETTPGLARFKLGSGAKPWQLGATWMSAPGTGLITRAQRLLQGWAPPRTSGPSTNASHLR